MPITELRDVVVTVAPIPSTELLHVAVAGTGGLVLTTSQAHALAGDLVRQAERVRRSAVRRAARRRGRPAAAAR